VTPEYLRTAGSLAYATHDTSRSSDSRVSAAGIRTVLISDCAIRRGPHRGAAGNPGRRPVPPAAEPGQGRRAVRRRAPLLPGRTRSRAGSRPGTRALGGAGTSCAARACREIRRTRPRSCTTCWPADAGCGRSPGTWAGDCTPSSGTPALPPGRNWPTGAGRDRVPASWTRSCPTCTNTRARATAMASGCSGRSPLGYIGSYSVVRGYLGRGQAGAWAGGRPGPGLGAGTGAIRPPET
jgi:hypothetical protein